MQTCFQSTAKLPKGEFFSSMKAVLSTFAMGLLLASAIPAHAQAAAPISAPDVGALPSENVSNPTGAPNTSDNSANNSSPDNSDSTDNGAQPGQNQPPPANSTEVVSPPPPTTISNNPAYLYNPTSSPSTFSSPMTGPNGVSDTQSTQLTTPSLFTTGTNDLSQVATSTGLARAFSEQGSAEGFSSEPGMSYEHGPIDRLILGPLVAKFALNTTVVGDDNLQIGGAQQNNGGQKFSDVSYSITPAVHLAYGEEDGQKGYAAVTYAPTIQRFLHYSAQDADNQNLAFVAHYPFQRLALNAAEIYSQTSGVNVDTNQRTNQTTQVTTAGFSYDFDDKITLVTNAQDAQTTFEKGQGQGDTTDSVNTSLNYQYSEKLTVGPSFNIGHDKPENNNEGVTGVGAVNNQASNFEQALLGVNFQPTAKITTFAQAGMQLRQYDDNGGDTTDPIFAMGVGYSPFDSTTLSLNAFRNSRASSADSGQSVVTTGVGFSATQRFIQRIFLNLSLSYAHDEYQQTGGAGLESIPSYTEDVIIYRPSLSYDPTEWTAVALYYQYQDDKVHGFGNSYHDNQLGLSLSAQF